MKFLADLITPALVLAATVVALSTPAAAQETPTDPSALPSAQPVGPGPEVIAAHEAVLRKVIGELQAGTPNYDQMVPQLADAVRAAAAEIQPKLAQLGPIKTVEFAGSQQQALKFKVAFEKGETVWFIVITPEGKIGGLVFRDAVAPTPAPAS
jgi:hypothetical protein